MTLKHRILTASLAVVLSAVGVARLSADSYMYQNDSFVYGERWCTVGAYMGSGICLELQDYNNDPVFNPDTVNLVWYGGSVNWSSTVDSYYGGYGTHSNQNGFATEAGAVAYFTNDGNLLLLQGSSVKWETHTGGNYGGYLGLQDDSNIVVRASNNAALWSLF